MSETRARLGHHIKSITYIGLYDINLDRNCVVTMSSLPSLTNSLTRAGEDSGRCKRREAMTGRWWQSKAGERYWLEATDREDIGADLKAPDAEASGRDNWRYTLFRVDDAR